MCCVLAVGCGEPKIVMGQPMKLGFVLPTIEGRQMLDSYKRCSSYQELEKGLRS
jgi:hypothetical protein